MRKREKKFKPLTNEQLNLERTNFESKLTKANLKYLGLVKKLDLAIKYHSSDRKILKLDSQIQKQKLAVYYLNETIKSIDDKTYQKPNIIEKIKRLISRIKNDRQKAILGVIFLLPWLFGFLVLFLPSVVQTVIWSFQNVSPVGDQIVSSFAGIDNFKYIFGQYVVQGSTFVTDIYMFTSNLLIDLPLIIIFSILIAVLLNKSFKGSRLIKAIFFVPIIFNFALITRVLSSDFSKHFSSNEHDLQFMGQFVSFLQSFGIGQGIIQVLLDAVNRIFLILNISGIQILIFVAAIQSIPAHLYEAGKIEGATRYEMFWKITIPMITPLILVAAIYTVVDSFARAPIFNYIDHAMSIHRYGLAAAISVMYFLIIVVIILIVYLLFRKRVFYYDEK